MSKTKMIHSMELTKKGKMIDNGCIPMTKREIKIFDDYDKRKKAGKEIWYSFDPVDLMMKLTVKVKKDKLGNVSVHIRQPKKGECHHHECYNKVVKDYAVCKKHKRSKK